MNREMLFGWASHDLTTMAEEEFLFGHRNGMLSTYVDFVQSPNFPVDYAEAAIAREAQLLIAWEPWDWYAPIGEQPTLAPRRIAAGDHDAWITAWLKEAQQYAVQTHIVVRFAPEMNDSARPWGNGIETVGYSPTTPAEYIAMWRHVYSIKEQVAPDVDFMWNPLNFGAGAHPFETYFPGIAYVDVLGLNGFNWSNKQNPGGTWQSNDDVFGFGDDPETPINRLIDLAQGKPWGLAETASAPVDPWEFEPGGRYYNAWGSWVFEWPENPPYEETADDWITQEGWVEMLIRRCWDKGASFVNLFHTVKETDWRLTDTYRGRTVPDRVVRAGVRLAFGSAVSDPDPGTPGPGTPKPDHSSDVYDDVHTVGSTFGQDLTENSVRSLLLTTAKSPFQQAVENFFGALAGLVSGIANAITGNGGAQFTEISAAVDTRLGPIDTMITESADRHEALAEQVKANSTHQDAINQSIQDEHQRRWNALQGETNHLVQEQLWQHQDMIELLDIRAPKTYGWVYGDFPGRAACPWANDPSAVYQYASTPYIEVWSPSNTTYVACRGDWVGSYEITVNWSNGAVDNWVHTITEGGSRVGRFTGGASHISKRHVTVKAFPRSLKRKASMTVGVDGTYWLEYQNPTTDLVRYYSGDVLRLRNAATCHTSVVIQNEEGVLETIPAGAPIPATELRASEQPNKNWTYHFTEIDDPAVEYTFPTRRATGSRTEFAD